MITDYPLVFPFFLFLPIPLVVLASIGMMFAFSTETELVFLLAFLPLAFHLLWSALWSKKVLADYGWTLEPLGYLLLLSHLVVAISLFGVTDLTIHSLLLVGLLLLIGFAGQRFFYQLYQQQQSKYLMNDLVDEVLLRNSREQIVLESIANGIVLLDTQGRSIFANAAAREIFSHFDEEMKGKPFFSQYQVWDLNQKKELNVSQLLEQENHVLSLRARLLPQGQEVMLTAHASLHSSAPTTTEAQSVNTYQMQDMDNELGQGHIVTFGAAKIRPADGKEQGTVLTLVDITKEYQLEKMRLDFISIASHELRTPLTSLNGYLTLLQKKELPMDKHDFAVTHAKSSATRLTKLVSNILKVSSLEQNQIKVHSETFDLIAMIQEEKDNLQFQSESKDIHINFTNETGLDVYQVTSDSGILREVFVNLLDNAIKYSPEHEQIVIDVKLFAPSHELRVEIRDHGAGISPEDQQHLFRQFSRGENVLTEKTQGAGLGLYICKKMVQLIGGKIGLESSTGQSDHGTTFWFSIPVDRAASF